MNKECYENLRLTPGFFIWMMWKNGLPFAKMRNLMERVWWWANEKLGVVQVNMPIKIATWKT